MNQLQSTAINGISGWFKWSRVCCTARPVAWLDDERVTAAADDTNHRLNHFLSTHLFSKQSRSINYSHHQSIQQSLNQLLFTNNSSSSSSSSSSNPRNGGDVIVHQWEDVSVLLECFASFKNKMFHNKTQVLKKNFFATSSGWCMEESAVKRFWFSLFIFFGEKFLFKSSFFLWVCEKKNIFISGRNTIDAPFFPLEQLVTDSDVGPLYIFFKLKKKGCTEFYLLPFF